MLRSIRLIFALVVAVGAIAPIEVSSAVPSLRLVPYATGFSFPIGFVQDPTDPQVQFVIEQEGRIRTVVAGVVQPTPFLNLVGQISSGGERGLLGLAFPPNAAATGRFYVNYTDLAGNTVVARHTRSSPRVANPTGVPLVWSTGQPFIVQDFSNHNGGCLAFGPDGFLYIAMGDGGNGNDPNNRAQDPDSLLGKMLRIDVNVPELNQAGFVIPSSNPFRLSPGYRPEIWAIGLRNPWRFSFDTSGPGGTGAMIIGDVGQNRWEEIDYEPAGAGGRNYGWVVREGANPSTRVPAVGPAFEPMTEPVYQYNHGVGSSVTGGYVYRGASMPVFRGRYFFADFVSARVFSAAVTNAAGAMSDVVDHTAQFDAAVRPINVSSFGVDAAGELYLVDYSRGAVMRFAQSRPSAPTNVRIIR